MPRHNAWLKMFSAPEVLMRQKLKSQQEQDIIISMGTSCPCSLLDLPHALLHLRHEVLAVF